MKKFFILPLLFIFIITSGFGCKTVDKKVQEKMKPTTITYWRVYDDLDAFDKIMSDYKAIHPNVKFEYKKFRYEEYEKELINALAEDRGPDIFSIPSTWLTEYKTKLAPMPAQISMVYPVTRGTLKKETFWEIQTKRSLSLKELKNNFIDIVYDDAVLKDENQKESIYGLPLYIDTLAMFYNPNLLNNAGISEVPKYWNKQFQQAVKKLSKQNTRGNIIQSGVSMGGAENIERSSDIIALLMMQNGAIMEDEGAIMFHSIPPGNNRQYNPGLEALRFYTDFSNPAKEVYCWNSNMENSLTLFAQGSLAMMFGYSYHLPIISSLSPKLKFQVAKMPQIEGNSKQVNYANYWMEVVSNKSKNIDTAWDFIQFAANADHVGDYLEKAKKPTALRSLINKQIEDLEIGPFAEQLLTAKSWYKGKDSRAAEKALLEMIDAAVKNQNGLEDAINDAARKVQQTVN